MSAIAIRIITALAPLLLTPALGWAIGNGTLNFGGGEKDIILLIPWVVWAIGFATAALVYWWRHAGLGPSLLWAVAWATGVLIFVGLAFALLAWRGGRESFAIFAIAGCGNCGCKYCKRLPTPPNDLP